MADALLRKIQSETSAACLRSLRSWAIGEGKWSEELHQGVYARRLVELEARWK